MPNITSNSIAIGRMAGFPHKLYINGKETLPTHFSRQTALNGGPPFVRFYEPISASFVDAVITRESIDRYLVIKDKIACDYKPKYFEDLQPRIVLFNGQVFSRPILSQLSMTPAFIEDEDLDLKVKNMDNPFALKHYIDLNWVELGIVRISGN